MESTWKSHSTGFYPVVAEACLLQSQPPNEETCTSQIVEHELAHVDDMQGIFNVGSEFRSLLPNLQDTTTDNLGADQVENIDFTSSEPLINLSMTTLSHQAMSYPEDTWELHKPRIRYLYLEENRKLREVMDQMKEEQGFRPSVKMYKTHIAAWGLYRRNRKHDVITMLNLKNIRDSAGKPSALFRCGKHVDLLQIHSYLKRKKLNPQAFEQGLEKNGTVQIPSHICVRTPSPIPPASNLLFLPGASRYKEKILLSIDRGYTSWVRQRQEAVSQTRPTGVPDMFSSAEAPGVNTLDVMHILLQHGLKLFRANRTTKGGSYFRAAFVFIEFLIKELSTAADSRELNTWIFGFWKLLTSLPYEISRMLLTQMVKLSQIYTLEKHPMLEILGCLADAHREGGEDFFLPLISSTWTDAINAIRVVFQSYELDAEVLLPHSLWMGDHTSHFQLQECVLEFRRTETIESWQRRAKELSFAFCGNRQLCHPAPSHKDILTLMWLRRSLVDSSDTTSSLRISMQGDRPKTDLRNFLVKTATLTRLELSVGEESHSSGSEDIRVLSGDVYQVRYRYEPRLGEDMNMFKDKHNIDTLNFEILKHRFKRTSGIESDKVTWFKWLQLLEESLIGQWKKGQKIESVVSCLDLRGKGLICSSITTTEGEIGMRQKTDSEITSEKDPPGDGWLKIDVGVFKN